MIFLMEYVLQLISILYDVRVWIRYTYNTGLENQGKPILLVQLRNSIMELEVK